tara:strand:- start:2093 stop:2380 length:288 start_codon:yes stop_codon:yes gene_type:complete
MAESKARFIAANFRTNGRPRNVTGATGAGGGGGGGGVDSASTLSLVGFEKDVFRVNNDNVSSNHTIDSADRAMSAGPVSVDSGVTITVNGYWSVV